MFGIKWLTPEKIALLGAAVATGGAAAPALLGAEGAAAAGAVGAEAAAAPGLLAAASPAAEAAAAPGLIGAVAPAAASTAAAPESLYSLGSANLGSSTGLGGTGAGLSVAPGQGLQLANTGAQPGLLDTVKAYGSAASDQLKAANEAFKPFGQAMSSAQLVASAFPASKPVETPPPKFGGGGNPTFAALEQQQQAMDAQRMQEEMMRRQAQQKLLMMIGGNNGRLA